METARCRAFLTAAESGSFSAAAELLGYTPSGVSQLVSALENELGVSLLSRSKRGVALTPSGESLLPAAREMLRQEQRLREQAAELKGLAMGSVTIATYASIARRWLPEVIRAFRADYPQIRIDVVEGIWQELHQMVGERRADMAFMSYAEPMPYDFVELTKDPMLAILPRDHPLAGAERYPLERCREETFIMPAKGRDVDIVEMLARAGIELQIKVSTLENLSALAMIDDIQAGRDIHPTRGPIVAPTFKENERVLAGFLDGHENEGPSAGRATLLGREIAAANGWTEPVAVEVADEATDTKGEEAK